MKTVADDTGPVKPQTCPICLAQARGLEDGFCGRAKRFGPNPDANQAYLFAYKRGVAARKRALAGIRHSGECEVG